MRFVFSYRFFIFLIAGFVPLVFVSYFPRIGYLVLFYDLCLLAAAIYDYRISLANLDKISATRIFDQRFAIGVTNTVRIVLENRNETPVSIDIKDESPPEMRIDSTRQAAFVLAPFAQAEFIYHLTPPKRGEYQFGKIAARMLSDFGLVKIQTGLGGADFVKVFPDMVRARHMEIESLGINSFLAVKRRAERRGEGRDFESLRDYVRGDEMRHISWPATARRFKLTTRQYQIERDQTVIIGIDCGRLMTGRIDGESKFDSAVHAVLALVSACAKAGDNCGVLVFGRQIKKFIPPKPAVRCLEATLEALCNVEPEMIEPSYARALQFIASNVKRRSLVVLLTDLVDQDSSRDLIMSLSLIRPKHLPMVVTIGDKDLKALVSKEPSAINEVFRQSAAEEIIFKREAALRKIESSGGLALDVTTATLAPRMLESYLKVKERGML